MKKDVEREYDLTSYSMILSIFDELEANKNTDKEAFNKALETLEFMANPANAEEVMRGFTRLDKDKTDFSFEISLVYKFLGRVYFDGIGLDKDYEISRKYFEHDLLLEDTEVWSYIGRIYFFGLGCEVDKEKGIEYLTKSALVGNRESKKILEDQMADEDEANNIFLDALGIDEVTLERIKKDNNIDIERY